MTASLCQPHIRRAPANFGRALTYRTEQAADTARALVRLRDGFDLDWGVVGIGEPCARVLGRELSGLRGFPGACGAGCSAPSTQESLWVMLDGDDRSTLFDRSRALDGLLAPAFEPTDALDTFLYRGGRDLTGYEDGTENPKGDAAEQAALISAPSLAGGSFVAVQRWVHDLARFAAFSPERRDATIGRNLQTNEELADAPVTAHVKRAAQERYDPPAFMLRRSMPWTSQSAQGLEFVAYGADLDRFERVLRRMLGAEDGQVDALLDFSRPITGGYYFCPPRRGARLDLRCLGL